MSYFERTDIRQEAKATSGGLQPLNGTLGRLVQLGFVVRDLDEAIKRFTQTMGIGNWKCYTIVPPVLHSRKYLGEEGLFSMRVAISTDAAAGVDYELIEPLTGPSIYKDFLNSHGEGLQHLGYERIASFDDTLKAFQEKGVKPVMQGQWGEIRFAYLNTNDRLGTCIEFWEMPEGYVLPED